MNNISIRDGKIMLTDGMSYRVMVIPGDESIDVEVLRKIEQLVKEGMTLIVSSKPSKATGLTNFPGSDAEVNKIIERLYGGEIQWVKLDGKLRTENEYGKGRVIWGQDINQALMGIGVKPDMSFTSLQKDTKLDYIHRTMSGQEVYFVINRHAYKGINDSYYRYMTSLPDRYVYVNCTFRGVSGKVPEMWDPITGEVTRVLNYREENGNITIPLHFAPQGSVFILFSDKNTRGRHVVNIENEMNSLFPINNDAAIHPPIEIKEIADKPVADIFRPGSYKLLWSDGTQSTVKDTAKKKEVTLGPSWIVHFNRTMGAPETITFKELKSWTSFSEEGIKYYSGKAAYENSFTVSKTDLKEMRLILNLGLVREMAVVRINGHRFNLLWTSPFELDITGYTVAGINKIEIDVINLWPNRLIGDGKFPKDERMTKTNIIKFEAPGAEKYLREAGLIGPVKLWLIPRFDL